MENEIRENLETTGWRKSVLNSTFKKIIPQFNLNDLRDWCASPYAMSLSQSYIHHAFDLKSNKTKIPHILRFQGLVSR